MLINALRGGASFLEVIIYILSSLAVIFITLPVHEFAHGFVATRLGDPTPRWQGRLTLNPLAHIDYLGAAAILLFGVGWAKPVEVNARYFKNPKRGMAITALAGPLSNILLSFVIIFLFYIILIILNAIGVGAAQGILMYIALFTHYIAEISIYLAVFNLIPIPPFDGSRILFAFLPEKYYFKIMQYERFIFIGVLVLIYTGLLDRPISLLSDAIFMGVKTVASLPLYLFF